MADFDNTNRGVLFVNDKKAPGSNQPDRSGTLNVDGVEYFFDGWLKNSAAGVPFLSVSVKRKDKQPQGSAPAPRAPAAPPRQAPSAGGSGFDDMDSEIPF